MDHQISFEVSEKTKARAGAIAKKLGMTIDEFAENEFAKYVDSLKEPKFYLSKESAFSDDSEYDGDSYLC